MSAMKTKPNRDTAMTLMGTLTELVGHWWQGDRVRVSPAQGRLLRLQPPCILRIGDRVYEVIDRRVGNVPEGAFVAYGCDDGVEHCELRVFPVGLTAQPRVLIRTSNGEVELEACDILVFG